jgi:predicted HicB family RNase H-like nuclease
MEENNKRRPGRPTDKRKDTILRLRIDSDTHALLSEYAKVKKVSMSELVREAINKIVEEQ